MDTLKTFFKYLVQNFGTDSKTLGIETLRNKDLFFSILNT